MNVSTKFRRNSLTSFKKERERESGVENKVCVGNGRDWKIEERKRPERLVGTTGRGMISKEKCR